MERRRLLLAAAGLGGVLLGLLLLRTVFGGDESQDDLRSALPQQTTTTAPPGSSASERASLPLVSAPGEGRDPFLPVVAVPRALSVQAPRQTTSGSSPTTQTTAVTSASAATAGGGYASLELKSISQDANRVVQLTVDGQTYAVTQGETFSYGYRLERVIGNCVEVSAQGARAEMCLPTPAP
ncbi:MAG: hypothetical protein M3314_01330 [Actinomycetota bacterium]|nr:hypothetical protein [Actinomycetota bacterium]